MMLAKESLAYLEVVEFAAGGLFEKIDICDFSKAWALFSPLNHLLKLILFTCNQHFDAAIGQVSYPTREAELLTCFIGANAVADALNPAANQ